MRKLPHNVTQFNFVPVPVQVPFEYVKAIIMTYWNFGKIRAHTNRILTKRLTANMMRTE